MKQRIAVLIPDGETWEALKVIRSLAEQLGIKAYILSRKRFPITRFSRYSGGCISYEHVSAQEWLAQIESCVKRLNIDLLLPVKEAANLLVIENKERLKHIVALPRLPSRQAFGIVRNKWLFNRFLSDHNLGAVPALYLGKPTGPLACGELELESLKYPVILKPVSQGGGFGIARADSPVDVKRIWQNGQLIRESEYMLERYIFGTDICMQVFCRSGSIVCYTIQQCLCHGEGHFGPQRLMKFIDEKEIVDASARLIDALRWEGLACIDFRRDSRDNSLKFLEVNPRTGQAVLGSVRCGVNFPVNACFDALGYDLPKSEYRPLTYAHTKAYLIYCMDKLSGKSQRKVCIDRTGLSFTVRDPLPEIYDTCARVAKKCFTKIRHD